MAKDFDAYHVWLGIPPDQQPVNHYRLLGLENFENDPAVIDNAADRQMAHLRQFQLGQNRDESQRVLNEVSAARICLLNAESKAQYDASLARSMVIDEPVARASSQHSARSVAPRLARATRNSEAPVAAAMPRAQRLLPAHAKPNVATPAAASHSRRPAARWTTMPVVLAGAAVVVVLISLGILLASKQAAEPPSVGAKSPKAERPREKKAPSASTKRVSPPRTVDSPAELPPTPKPEAIPTPVAPPSNVATFVEFVPTSQTEPQAWRYATTEPAAQGGTQWFQQKFDDSSWMVGQAGFGHNVGAPARVRTVWSSGEIWLRREFQLTESVLIDPHVVMYHDDEADVYINNTRVLTRPGFLTAYMPIRLDRFGRQSFRIGRNLIAVRCKHSAGAQYIDAGIATRRLPLAPEQQTALDSAAQQLRSAGSLLLVSTDNAMSILRMAGETAHSPSGEKAHSPGATFEQAARAAEAISCRVGGIISSGRPMTARDVEVLVDRPAFSAVDSLFLEKCFLDDAVLEAASKLPNLRVLGVKGSTWERGALRHLSAMKGLLELDLQQTAITDDELASLAELQQLARLSLSSTTISDQGLSHLSRLTRLQEVSARNTRITAAGAKRALPRVEVTGTAR